MQHTAAVQMRRALVMIMLCLTISCCMPEADAAGPEFAQHAVQTEQILKSGPWEAGLVFLQSVNKTIADFADYVFDSTLTAVNKGEESENIGRLYFKKENRVRIESKSGTVNNGAVVVRTKDGKIRGAGGGMLRFMKMNLEEDSRMLQLPNGYNAIKSDLSSLTGDVCNRVAQNQAVSRVTTSPLSGQKWGVPVKVVAVKDANSGQLSDVIYVNASTEVPVEWDVYRQGKLISITTFGNFKANLGLDDHLFEL